MNFLSFIPQPVIIALVSLALRSVSRPAANALLKGVDNLEKVAQGTNNPYDDVLVKTLRSFLSYVGDGDQ